ncbi:UNVERIFIED_CONTAM: hypothetical protein K2H54_031399 [Gekko kuhli]
MSNKEGRGVPVTTAEEVPVTMEETPITTGASGGLDYESVYGFERYSGGGEDQLEQVKCQLQAQQEEVQQELHEMMLKIPHIVANTVQHKLWLQQPATPAKPPEGADPARPTSAPRTGTACTSTNPCWTGCARCARC